MLESASSPRHPRAGAHPRRACEIPGHALLFAAGDNVGASPANSGLLQETPAIDV
jgi:hypothetical protein